MACHHRMLNTVLYTIKEINIYSIVCSVKFHIMKKTNVADITRLTGNESCIDFHDKIDKNFELSHILKLPVEIFISQKFSSNKS